MNSFKMRKSIILLFSFLLLVGSISSHKISFAYQPECDAAGNQTFRLGIEMDGKINQPFEFSVTLKNQRSDEIKASCIIDELTSDQAAENSDIENDAFDSKEAKSDVESSYSKENEELSDNKNEDSDFFQSSDQAQESNNALQNDSAEEGSDNPESQNSENLISDTKAEENQGRRLMSDSTTVLQSVCTLEGQLHNADWFTISTADNGLEFDEWTGLYLYHCYTKEEGLKRAKISLSFRQVSGFNFAQKVFYFYGLTTENIKAEFTISFFVFLITGDDRGKSPIEINCTSGEAVEVDDIAPIQFECKLPELEFDSIEIAYTNYVGGLPMDKTLLNPFKTDEAIKNGTLIDLSNVPAPQLLDFGDEPIENRFNAEEASEGIIKLTLPLGGIDKTLIKVGKSFEIFFTYPNNVFITFYIDAITGDAFTLKGFIFGKLDHQPLVFEQTVVSIDGVELFVLPGFSTPDITTEGFKGEIPYEKENEGESDKPSEGESGKEGESDKPSEGEFGKEGESNKPNKEGEAGKEGESNKPSEGESGKEGESNKPNKEGESGKEGESNKPSEGESGKEGESNKPNKEGEAGKEGESNKPSEGESGKEGESNKPNKEREAGKEGESNKPSEGESGKEGESNKPNKEGEAGKEGESNKPGSEGESDKNVEENTEAPIDIHTNSTGEETISQEDAEIRAEIPLSFRQLNGFSFNRPTLTFNFLGLTTQPLEKDYSIVLIVNLLTLDGAEEDTTDIECILQEDVNVEDGKTLQANFKCEKSELDGEYIGLKLVRSDDVAGIPTDDDTLINPKLTDDAIAAGLIKNCTADPSVPPIFDAEKVGECDKSGKFTIEGSLSEDKTITSTFTLSLTYPQGTLLTCSFVDKKIQCIADNEIKGTIIMEQTIVTSGAEELFILTNFTSENMACSNGLKLQAKEKLNVDVSFRQVSHPQKTDNGLSFFFAGFANSELKTTTPIQINVIVVIGGNNVEKVAECKLRENVKPTEGEQTQGDFDCNVPLESGEDAKPESLTISEKNDNIGGCSDLSAEEASPSLTEEAIENADSATSALSQTIDFSVEENKEIVPPSFKVTNINMDGCNTRGKLTVTGTFSEEITEEMTFDLPFSFPKAKAKCTVDEAQANTEVQIICKMNKVRKFLKFKSFVIEPRLIKKKSMEMLYIEPSTVELTKERFCESYDEVKKRHAIKRRDAPFSFLQMGRPANFGWLFFMAITQTPVASSFDSPINIEVTVTIEAERRRRNLQRILADTVADKGIDCTTDTETQTDKTAVVKCGEGEGKAKRTDFNSDNIAGAPDTAKVPESELPKKEDLTKIDNLPSITITNIASNKCSTTGKYIIEGTSDETFENPEKFTIPFSSPDSSGLCTAKVNDKKVTINCDNTEEFQAPDFISIDPQLIKYDNGTGIFKIAKAFTAAGFSCAISDDSLKNPFPSNYSITPSNPDSSRSSSVPGSDINVGRTNYSKKSSGLSGGAIAGIIISCIVVIAAVIALIALGKSGAAKSSEAAASIDNTSSINRFNLDNKNPNMV